MLPTPSDWDSFLAQNPAPHLLQTSTWGELKSAFGWQATRVLNKQAGAQILFRRLALGLRMAYIPRGPLGKWDAGLWEAIDKACRAANAVFLKVEPDVWEDPAAPTEPPPGFTLSQQSIQPPRTILLDIRDDEECILGRMKQKTRYNIKLAQKKGVIVQPSNDIEAFHHLMELTAQRDVFGVHSIAYYQRAYQLFHDRCLCELFLATYEEQPLGGIMVFCLGPRAWYFYGGSSNEHRDRMPNYLLQWEAIRWARAQGCTEYDLWGVPDADEDTLEAEFSDRPDGLWGVYRFKRGFGGRLARTPGPWDRIYKPTWYKLYQKLSQFRAGRRRA